MRRWQVAVAGIVIGIILLIAGVPWWAPFLIILAAIAVPVVGYAMLDSNQRARVRRIRRRQIGR